MREVQGIVDRVLYRPEQGQGSAILLASLFVDGKPIGTYKVFSGSKVLEKNSFFHAYGLWQDSDYRGNRESVFSAKMTLPSLPVVGDCVRFFMGRILLEEMLVSSDDADRLMSYFSDVGWHDLPRRLIEYEVGLPEWFPSGQGRTLRGLLVSMDGAGAVHIVRKANIEENEKRIILTSLGDGRVLFEKPYDVVELTGVGFLSAHRIAKVVGRSNILRDKISALFFDALVKIEANGHTNAPFDHIERVSRKIVSGENFRLPSQEEIVSLLDDRFVSIDHMGRRSFGRGVTVRHEADIASGVGRLLVHSYGSSVSGPSSLGASIHGTSIDPGIVDMVLCQSKYRRLDDIQSQAVRMTATSAMSIVHGGPGTGKSTIMEAVVEVHERFGFEVLLAAPTGKAAKRISETTGRAATTLHVLLEAKPSDTGSFSWRRNRNQPIGSGRPLLVVVDESSMMDVELAAALLNAIPGNGRGKLVLVGDCDQLPSVGPGAVLRDLVQSDVLPSTRLVNVYRQGRGSEILSGAAAIRDGSLPDLVSARRGSGDVAFFPARPEQASDLVMDLVRQMRHEGQSGRSGGPKKYDENMIVISPQLSGFAGVHDLNDRLASLFNPDGRPFNSSLAYGDRVILTRNDHSRGVMNGEMGVIERAGRHGGFCVRFDDGSVHEFDKKEASLFMRAHAITAHRSQGSQYDTVFLVLHSGHSNMLNREILYTAWTRAKKRLFVVGEEEALRVAVSRRAGQERLTLLKHFCTRFGSSQRLRTGRDSRDYSGPRLDEGDSVGCLMVP